ncbi:hypothetical protein [Novosphingobium guangzhouense]|uniref:Uncharacterized protein n=1 Tax=Novosphingobium guangzhouense TaxID=1850347 RepID=A0A2K2G474_9SPHN|nr:hypothetical protein [Novosphingobium guangzhouense]PNU05821.1 hypothetical protein A8V01_14750 [Novosphingobium guangzhouense]
MDEDLRGELNRMWAELRVMQLVTARLAARQFDRAEIERWNEAMVAAFEAREDFSAEYRANMVRALDEMGRILLDARDAIAPPPAR